MKQFIATHKSRIVWTLISLGLLLTSILLVQDYGATTQSCVGLGSNGSSSFNCEAVTQSDPLKQVGISSSILGFLFFLNLLVVALYEHFVSLTQQVKKWVKYATYAGFGYLLLLSIYQLFFLDGTCLYCLLTFAVTGLLAYMLQVEPANYKSAGLSPVFMGSTLLIILVGPYLINDSLQSAVTGMYNVGECKFASNPATMASSAYQSVVNSGFKKGNNSSDIVVMEFFDPLCPHCQDYYPTFKKMTENYKDDALFVYQPIPISEQSVTLISALYASAERDKFFVLLDEMFTSGNGVSAYRLNQYLDNLNLDNKELVEKINNGYYNSRIQQVTEQAGKLGLSGVPSVLFNGKVLADANMLENCLRRTL